MACNNLLYRDQERITAPKKEGQANFQNPLYHRLFPKSVTHQPHPFKSPRSEIINVYSKILQKVTLSLKRARFPSPPSAIIQTLCCRRRR